MDKVSFRRRVSEAVHWAVCEFTQSNGCNRCLFYSIAGAALRSRLTGRNFMPQAGSVFFLIQPPSHWRGIDVTQEGDPCASMMNGWYHCWIAETDTFESGDKSAKTIIDFTSRHFKQIVETPEIGEPSSWTQVDPPDYVWLADAVPPYWLQYQPNEAAVEIILEEFVEKISFNWSRLVALASDRYVQLLGDERKDHEERVRRVEREKRRIQRKAERQRRKKCRR